MHMEISTVTPISIVTTAIMSITPASFANGNREDPLHILITIATDDVTWSNIAMTNLCLTHLIQTSNERYLTQLDHKLKK